MLCFAVPLSGGLAWVYPRMVIAITAILSILFLSCDYFSLTLSFGWVFKTILKSCLSLRRLMLLSKLMCLMCSV